MNFIVRPAKISDIEPLFDLARQFTLLNLPADRKSISAKIELSMSSFRGKETKDTANYVFVIEEIEGSHVAGSAQVVSKCGTDEDPNYSFKILKREHFSGALGIGFIHQILRLTINTDGPTEVGGLVIDKNYRGRPEKLGKIISLNRFVYIGLNPERFETDLHSEMAPPLTDEGRSEFWEALGRRFTGLPYQEADQLSHQNKEFIRTLFPEGDVYLCLLDSKARLVLGRVGQETQPALHLLEAQGFKYKGEVDPFDGGPHLSVRTQDVKLIKKSKRLTVGIGAPKAFHGQAQIGIDRSGDYRGGLTSYCLSEDKVYFPDSTMRAMSLDKGEVVFFSPMS